MALIELAGQEILTRYCAERGLSADALIAVVHQHFGVVLASVLEEEMPEVARCGAAKVALTARLAEIEGADVDIAALRASIEEREAAVAVLLVQAMVRVIEVMMTPGAAFPTGPVGES